MLGFGRLKLIVGIDSNNEMNWNIQQNFVKEIEEKGHYRKQVSNSVH